MFVSVIVPTYNEKDNIKSLIDKISIALSGIKYNIIVVDDNSPDGSADIALGMANNYPIRVIRRSGKLGLATAIIDGFKAADGDIIGVIDADLQHPPELIRLLANAVNDSCEIAIASRYINGGSIESWPFLRRLVSKVAILLSMPLTRVKDPMSGYFFIKKDLISNINFSTTGYKLLLEILTKTKYHGIKELPYKFNKRNTGASKLDNSEYLKYIKLLINLYYHKLLNRK